MNKPKRAVVISDPHCGHQVGLTHPDFDARPQNSRSDAYRLWKLRRACWNFVSDKAAELQPIDLLIVNGDCIDGKGDKSGATELITADRDEQCDMAVAAIEQFNAGAIVMSYGTAYHTGVREDHENKIAKQVKALKIGSHDWVDVNGLIFDYRHHVGSSVIPHGRHTAIARERLWAVLWAERGEYPRSDVLIRSHVHYHAYCGGDDWLAMTTPALQAYGSKFGARRASGVVDYGFVSFDVVNRESYSWRNHILRFKRHKQKVIKI
jgi:hypothetical protein